MSYNRIERHNSMIKVGNISVSLSLINGTTRIKISNEIEEFYTILNKCDLTNIYITHHPTTAESIFFSSTHKNSPE